MTTDSRSLLFKWDHHRTRCTACGKSILWPNDDRQAAMCEPCWDAAAEGDSPSHHYLFSADDLAYLSTEVHRIMRDVPRGERGRQLDGLARRYGVTTRTLYRHALDGRHLVSVELFGWRALFTDVAQQGKARLPRRVTKWEIAT